MIRPEVLRRRLNQLDEYLSILRDARAYSLEEFTSDPERYGSAERFLHLALEALTDMASHVVAERDLGPVDRYSDLPRIFAEQDWIDDDLCEKWIRMIGFRNVLVHDYLDVDRRLVHEVLQHQLGDIARLQAVFARFL